MGIWASAPDNPALSATDGAGAARSPAVSVQVRPIAPVAADDPRLAATSPAADPSKPPAAPPVTAPLRRNTDLNESPPRTELGALDRPVVTPAQADASPAFEPDPSTFAPAQPSSPAPPTYKTAPPPSLDLRYDVQRGAASGEARLTWRLDADGQYALEMRGSGAPAALTPHWTSRGKLDADGIAPERFSVSRRGRERHAANFRRDVGIVSFAGPAGTWPLAAGAQDRLSWMVQLAAVFQADPALAAAGTQVSMMVVGAHGDAGLWTFTVQQQVAVEGPGGEVVPAWQLHRDSAHAHDPQVQVWLAPSLHHLPMRVRLTLPRSGESTEMHLRALQAP
jgi:Protein of unknown function (DUF3108)